MPNIEDEQNQQPNTPAFDDDDTDPFVDLKPVATPSTPKVVKRTLEDTVSPVSNTVVDADGQTLAVPDKKVFSDWVSSRSAEPPEAMRMLLSNFTQKVGNTLSYQVAESMVGAIVIGDFLTQVERKVFSAENLNSFSAKDPELLALMVEARKSQEVKHKLTMAVLKDFPHLFESGQQADPNPKIAEITQKLKGLSPQQLDKMLSSLDLIAKE